MLKKLNEKKATYQEEQRLTDKSIEELKKDYKKNTVSKICKNMATYHKKSPSF